VEAGLSNVESKRPGASPCRRHSASQNGHKERAGTCRPGPFLGLSPFPLTWPPLAVIRGHTSTIARIAQVGDRVTVSRAFFAFTVWMDGGWPWKRPSSALVEKRGAPDVHHQEGRPGESSARPDIRGTRLLRAPENDEEKGTGPEPGPCARPAGDRRHGGPPPRC